MNVITYVKNSKEFLAELEAKAPSYITKDEDGNTTGWNMFHTPVVKNESGSLALSMLNGEIIEFISENMTTIKVLGTYEQIFSTPELDELYKSVYSYDKPVEYTDEEGNVQTYILPKKIGVFA